MSVDNKGIYIINIIKENSGWRFGGTFVSFSNKPCDSCSSPLYSKYVYVINKLKEANLLDKCYPLLCCNCYNKRKRWTEYKEKKKKARNERRDSVKRD